MKNEHVKTDKQDREQRMRALIKKAAFTLMADRGIDQVSMREIAEKVKVTKPVLYYYFKNKEDLCRSIVEEHEQRFFVLMEDAYKKGHNLEEVLNMLLKAYLEFFHRNPVNSKFIVQTLAYTLNKKFPAESKTSSPEMVLGEFLSKKESDRRLPVGAAKDISLLVSSLFAKVMISVYVDTYVRSGAKAESSDEETARRMTKIILLGVKKYYEEQEK